MAIQRSKTSDLEITTKTKAAPKAVTDNIVDIDFKELQKKKFRLDRDNNRVIELNTSDITVISRLEEIYPKMLDFVREAQEGMTDTASSEEVLQALMDINKQMKELLNYAFNSDIADKACPEGTLFDPINGKFRFEYIIEKLVGLYDTNFTNEFALMKKRVEPHTSKYTKKRK